MPRVKSDLDKNRLYLKFSKMDADDLSDEVFEVVKAVRTLSPGFTCLTEIQEFSVNSEKESRFMKLIMEFLSLMGVSKVVRVGDKDSHNQLNIWSKDSGGYAAVWADTKEHAEKILDS